MANSLSALIKKGLGMSLLEAYLPRLAAVFFGGDNGGDG
jgi:hypothetical protein